VRRRESLRTELRFMLRIVAKPLLGRRDVENSLAALRPGGANPYVFERLLRHLWELSRPLPLSRGLGRQCGVTRGAIHPQPEAPSTRRPQLGSSPLPSWDRNMAAIRACHLTFL